MPQVPYRGSDRVLINVTANADLSAYQYRGVQLFASSTIGLAPSGTNGTIGQVGVLEQIPISQSGAICQVCVFGPTTAIAGAAITAGAEFIFGANNTAPGYVYPADSAAAWGKTGTVYVSGWAIDGATAASQLITVFVNPHINRLV